MDNQRIAQLKPGDKKNEILEWRGVIVGSEELQLLSSDARVRRLAD